MPVDLNNISGFACAALRCDTCRSIFGMQTWQSCALDFEYTLLHMSYLYRHPNPDPNPNPNPNPTPNPNPSPNPTPGRRAWRCCSRSYSS